MSVYSHCDVCGRDCYCHRVSTDMLCSDCYGWARRLVWFREGIKITLSI